MRAKQLLLLTCAVGAISASAGMAMAQTGAGQTEVVAAVAPPAPAPDDGQATNSGEVVVTAVKRNTKLQDTPVAVSAYSSQTRDVLGIDSVYDLTNIVPGLAYSTTLDRAFIRGVGRNTNQPGTDPGVAVYTDGFYTGSTVAIGLPSLFTGSVEVDRGPQGTLFGRNAIGGDISSTSNLPKSTFGGEVRLVVANYEDTEEEVTFTGPITDNIQFRVGGYNNQQNRGYFNNAAGGPSEGSRGESNYYEGQLQGEFGRFDAWFKYYGGTYDLHQHYGSSPAPYNDSTAVTNEVAGLYVNPLYGSSLVNPTVTNPYSFATDTPQSTALHDNHTFIWHANYHLDWADLKYVGGYSQYHYHQDNDGDGTARGPFLFSPPPYEYQYAPGLYFPIAIAPTEIYPVNSLYEEHKRWTSHELDLSSNNKGPFQWIVGLYTYYENYEQTESAQSMQQTQLATTSLGPFGTTANPNHYYYYGKGDANDLSYSGFGQIDWEFVPHWKLTLGARETHDEKTGFDQGRYVYFVPNYPGATALDVSETVTCPTTGNLPKSCTTGPNNSRTESGSWNGFSGTAGVEWTPDHDTLMYAKYSRGYKSGGFSTGGPAPAANPTLLPETIDAYEIGLKKTLPYHLVVDSAIYYYNYKNMQDTETVLNPATNILSGQGFNIAEARDYGLDLEANWNPVRSFSMIVTYSYINAKIVHACCLVDIVDPHATQPGAQPVGNPIATTNAATGLPDYEYAQKIDGATLHGAMTDKIAITGIYKLFFNQGELDLLATYDWRTGYYSSFFDRPYYKSPDAGQVDLRATFYPTNRKWTLIAYAHNVAGSQEYEYVTPVVQGGTVYESPVRTTPRTFGVELQYRF